MNKSDVNRFIKALGGNPQGLSESGWVTCSCILAPWTHAKGSDAHPSFAIKAGKEKSIFNCFSCGQMGSLQHLITLLTHHKADPAKYNFSVAMALLMAEDSGAIVLDIKDPDQKEFRTPQVTPWPEAYLSLMPLATTVLEAKNYLYDRGVAPDTADDLDIRWDETNKIVYFPIRDFDKHLTGVRGRRLYPDAYLPKYHICKWMGHSNNVVWYGEHWVDFSKPVLMVESVFDVAAVWPHYKNVVSPMSAGMGKDKLHRMLNQCAYIVTVFDADDAGAQARKKISNSVSDKVFVQHLYPPAPYKDPGEMPHPDLETLLKHHLPGVK